MSRALLDVSVLLALMDPDHLHHETVHRWAGKRAAAGWASCALTQNGFVRIVSQPRYPHPVPVPEAIELLRRSMAADDHEFWPCDMSLTSDDIESSRLLGHRQITDTYLLGLAVKHGGHLVTLDTSIDRGSVPRAGADALLVLD